MAIKDIHNPWRDALLPASFDHNEFFVDVGGREGGQRLVIHEFPKRDTPYTENMGRRYIAFNVRAYCIQSAIERDYRPKRDALQRRLDEGTAGNLQLPTMQPMKVICQRYRLQEEERLGGYCVFDIQFVEAGSQTQSPVSAQQGMLSAASTAQTRTLTKMSGQP